MTMINLLPKPSFTQKFFIPLLLIILLIVAATAFGLLYINQIGLTKEREIEQANVEWNQQIAERNQLLQISALTREYQQFANNIEQLKDGRREWNVILDGITSHMPARSFLQSINATANDVSLTIEMEGLDGVAEYAEMLRQMPMFESVKISNVTLINRETGLSDHPNTYRADLQIRLLTTSQGGRE